MNLDRLCLLLICALLPLLYLPYAWLNAGSIVALVIGLIALSRRKIPLLICALLIGISYMRVIYFAENVDQQRTETRQETIFIEQILKQYEHQTAIAKRPNGEQIYLVWQSDTPMQLGHFYETQLKIKPLASRLNEGNFNRQRWYIANHLSATATVKQAKQVVTPSHFGRNAWIERVLKQTENLSGQGIILALAFGERAWLKNDDWALFQQTTTAHLVAISGLHIGLAFAVGFWGSKLVLWAMGAICFSLRQRQALQNGHIFAIFCGLFSACGYSFLAGFSLPTLRAIIAILLVTFCRLQRRHYTAWQLWLRGVALLLVFDPLSLLSDSFWLSVLAVASLIFWYRHFPLKRFEKLSALQTTPLRRVILNLIHLQIGITLCFLPVQFAFFEGHTPWAFLANLVIVPFYSFLVVPAILIGLLSDNAFNIWVFVDLLIQLSLTLLKPMSGSWISLSQETQWALLSLDIGLLGLIYLRRLWGQALPSLIVGSLAFYQIPISLKLWQEPLLEWIHFDVGQGLAMAFVYRDNGQKKALLYDSGASWQGGSMAGLEIVPYLKRHAIMPITAVISHDDNDHAGGLKTLQTHFPQMGFILSGHRQDVAFFEPCIRGKRWQFGALEFRALYPLRLAKRAKNEDSCVLLVTFNHYRFLLTGDSRTIEENDFSGEAGRVNFLQVGHHGSKSSTGYTLLRHTQPEHAIISSGRFNPWKMPHPSVLERLNQFGVPYWNTAEYGMIKVDFYSDSYRIQTARHRYSAWYKKQFGR